LAFFGKLEVGNFSEIGISVFWQIRDLAFLRILGCVRFRPFSHSVHVGIVHDTTFGTLSPTCVSWAVTSLSTGRNPDDVFLSIDGFAQLRQFSRSVHVGIVPDTTFGTLSPTCVSWR